jgi:hypothetical protein
MTEIGRVARAHDDVICAALSDKERASLWSMLARIADEQELSAGVHPGFARIGDGKPQHSAQERQPSGSRSPRR